MGSVYTGLMEAAGASEKVFDYIDRKPRLAPSGTVAPDSVNGQVEFRNVTFNYPSRPDVPVLKVGYSICHLSFKYLNALVA